MWEWPNNFWIVVKLVPLLWSKVANDLRKVWGVINFLIPALLGS